MPLARRSPFRLLRDVNQRMEELMSGGDGNGQLSTWSPRTDVYESEDGDLVFELEAPGLERDDFDVSVEGSRLTISGERRAERNVEDEERDYLRSERLYGRFQRSYTLPRDVDPAEVQARYEDGVLHVTVPEAARRQQHSIEVE